MKDMPHSLEAERSVLSAVLNYNNALEKALDAVTPNQFYDSRHTAIFESFVDLFNEGIRPDLVTVSDWLSSRGRLKAVGMDYLAELMALTSTSAEIKTHSRIICEKATLRSLVQAGAEIMQTALSGIGEVEALINEAEDRVFKISQGRSSSGFVAVSGMMDATLHEIDAFKGGGTVGLATGFSRLDEMTSGLQAGELIVIAGRPSMGKTAFALDICVNVAESGVGVGLFSIEMSRNQIAQRLLCSIVGTSLYLMRKGKLPSDDYMRLRNASESLGKLPIFIDDSSELWLSTVRSRARRLKAKEKIGLIVVDYLQLMSAGKSDSRQQEISEISRGLKALAKDLDVPVVALSQLSRAPELRGENKKPQLSDLRESGAIEQDADLVMFVYREEYYLEREAQGCPRDKQGVAEILVAKQRNGPTGTVKLAFRKDAVSFGNVEVRTEN